MLSEKENQFCLENYYEFRLLAVTAHIHAYRTGTVTLTFADFPNSYGTLGGCTDPVIIIFSPFVFSHLIKWRQ